MGIAFLHKGFLGLTWCLFMASALTAQVVDATPKNARDNPPPPAGVVVPNAGPKLPLQPLPPLKDLEVKKVPPLEEQEDWKTAQTNIRWIGPILIAIAAALGGGWGIRQTMRKEAIPVRNAPLTRTEELGLGADGKGGVWRREGSPWEQ
jgi:hypothetical protein